MPVTRPIRGTLLTSAGARLRIAGLAVLMLWGAVLWAYMAPPAPSVQRRPSVQLPPVFWLVVASGQRAPTGGSFDRFDVASQPIVAPVNARGHVAFYASVIRTKAREGIFLATRSGMKKIAAIGDPVPGGGILSEFAKHPIPSLNDADKVAFGAAITGAQANEGVFLFADGALKSIALSGADAPGVPTGTFVEFDTPTLNNWDEVAFVATVRRGRETLEVLYLYSGGRLRKLVAEGDASPRGGTFEKFGVPAINNKGVVAFPAVLEHAAVLGGIFVAGTRDLRLVLGAGETDPNGVMLVRFSEHVAINDEDNLALGAHVSKGSGQQEAVLLARPAGLVQIAVAGDDAPGVGKFAGFGPWPSLGPGEMVAFVAAVDNGPGPLGLYVRQGGSLRRIVMTGERLPDGKILPGFALNPVATAGPNGGVTFATVAEPEVGQTGIYYFGPPPTSD
jgi:hypothetical protein